MAEIMRQYRAKENTDTKYQLKIDILKNDLLTETFDGDVEYTCLEKAREAAEAKRKQLFKIRTEGKIRDYRVGIIPANK